MSASEAEELVRRDITSLRAEYMRQRAEDEAALDRKHAGERETQPPEGE